MTKFKLTVFTISFIISTPQYPPFSALHMALFSKISR